MKNLLNFEKFNESSTQDNSHSYYLPTYEECRMICDANDFIFFETQHVVNGYRISIFNYRLAQPTNFNNPIPGKDIKAHELRGLTFVFRKDGSLFKRFLLLDKFWNLNQAECSLYSVVKHFKINNVMSKEDGSVASFVMLPDQKVIARSKASFISDQAVEIQRIYDNDPNIRQFVDWCLLNEIIPIFEYVSPKNRIVVSYANTDLILLRMRSNKTGEYLDLSRYTDKFDGITVAEFYNEHSLDRLIELQDIVDNTEGWIVQFENGKMIKIKTKWYVERHRLFTEEINRENTLIRLIITEQIDDVLAQLGEDDVKRAEVDRISNIINHYISRSLREINDLVSKYEGDRRDFAIRYRKEKWFPIAIKALDRKDILEMLKDKILNDTKHLVAAKNWIKNNE